MKSLERFEIKKNPDYEPARMETSLRPAWALWTSSVE